MFKCYLLIIFVPTDKTFRKFNVNLTDVILSYFKKKLREREEEENLKEIKMGDVIKFV